MPYGYSGSNYVVVYYPGYYLIISVDEYADLSAMIMMTGGAKAPRAECRPGQRRPCRPQLADFQVSGPTATSYQFDWKYNATLGADNVSAIQIPQSATLSAATLPYIVQ